MIFAESTSLQLHHGIQSPSVGVWANANSKNLWIHFGEDLGKKIGYRIFLNSNHSANQELKFQNRFTNLFLLGFQFYAFKIFAGIEKNQFDTRSIIFETKIYPTQSILFQYKENFQERSYFLSNLKGDRFKLGFALGKNYTKETSEWVLGISLSYQFDSFDFVLLGNSKSELENSYPSGLVKYNFETEKESIFTREENPTYQEKEFVKTIKPPKKKWAAKVYKLSLEELLFKKIPLRTALQISSASSNPDEYRKLILKLPEDISRKLKGIQYEKSLEDMDE